ncbi:hypothetical protein [Oceanisphaera marina]|nr:hypothetical protein [Oceanisphaera marina]
MKKHFAKKSFDLNRAAFGEMREQTFAYKTQKQKTPPLWGGALGLTGRYF